MKIKYKHYCTMQFAKQVIRFLLYPYEMIRVFQLQIFKTHFRQVTTNICGPEYAFELREIVDLDAESSVVQHGY